MNNQIILPDGRTAYEWTKSEKPCVNHWYLMKDAETDFLKIVKDYYDSSRRETLYKIVEYYNGDNLYSGRSLSVVREIMRNETYRKVE